MPEKTAYAAGQPCWIDLSTPDQDAAGEFYGALFGWELGQDGNAEETGGYRTARLGGKAVGGVMRSMQGDQPPAWMTHFKVEDADAAAEAVHDAGGRVLAEPMDVLDYGRLAVASDTTGAVFGLWQPRAHGGSEIAGEHGAPTWSELNTRDPTAARAFYGDVFGWRFEEEEFGEAGAYMTIRVGDATVGGLLDITDRIPDEVPNHWLVYFAVADANLTLETVRDRGGNVAFGPMDIPQVGRIAVFQDPFGAGFAVIQPDPEMGAGG
jgi:predicted enzyme related to lactoylglutathione lyase